MMKMLHRERIYLRCMVTSLRHPGKISGTVVVFAILICAMSTRAQTFARYSQNAVDKDRNVVAAYSDQTGSLVKNENDILLETALAKLQSKYDVNFGFSPRILENKYVRLPELNADNGKFEEVLFNLLDPIGLAFEKLDSKSYVIFEKTKRKTEINETSVFQSKPVDSAPLQAAMSIGARIVPVSFASLPEMIVKGRVTTEEDQSPIPGANILIKGTTTGTVTDGDGNFSIEVPSAESVLVVSSIGYATQEIPVNGRTSIDVVLVPDIQQLSEVIVVGYGTQKKADITAAIATMETENLEERPLARVDQALVGQMAGVRVVQTSGVPGEGFQIQVRGTGSITATTQPLYVIDGFPLEVQEPLGRANGGNSGNYTNGNPLDNINPSDIESIQVLKDAAAAAIYGSRAANGVVVITTKKGVTGKAKINFNTYFGFQEVQKKVDILNGEEWIDLATEFIDGQWVDLDPATHSASDSYDTRVAALGGVDARYVKDPRWEQPGHPGLVFIDWQDEMFRQGLVQNYNLSANGGTNFVKYFVSGDYLDQKGTYRGVDYKRYSARANVEVQASRNLKAGINLSPSFSIANAPGVDGKDAQTHLMLSIQPVNEADAGTLVGVDPYTTYAWGTSRVSPVAIVERSIGRTEIIRLLTTAWAEYDLAKGLSLRSSLNFDLADATSKSYTPAEVRSQRIPAGGLGGYTKKNFVNENTLSYVRTLNDVHQISLLAGTSYSSYHFENWNVNAGTFTSNDVTTINAAQSGSSGTSRESKNVLLSYFGRANYSYADRYLLSATIRRDGSSKFGKNTKWGTFPSVSVGWRISEEPFMKSISGLSELKLRGSWGVAGNTPVNDYEHVSLLNFANTSFGGMLATGQVQGNFPNPDLSWEESRTLNIGVDLGLFNNRVFTSLDYYTKRNTDLLLNIPVAAASGFTNAYTNIGEVENKGFDFELSGRILTQGLQWRANLNFSHNQSKVLKLGPNNTPISFNGGADIDHSILKVGEPMYAIWVVEWNGDLLTQAEIDNGVAMYNTEQEGDPKYTDFDGNGVINADDRQIIGDPQPDYTWGITNNFSYKGFDLSILIQGQHGGLIYSMLGRALDRTGQNYNDNHLGKYRNRWQSSEDNGKEGLTNKARSSFGRIKNTDWLYSSDYWRVRNVTLSYDLGSVIKNNVLQGARVYVTLENFFGADKYDGGFNPEAVNNNGEDYGGYPLSKGVIFGFNLTF
jgi:TonB-dependent starch-binding outer membrane protein SusC